MFKVIIKKIKDSPSWFCLSLQIFGSGLYICNTSDDVCVLKARAPEPPPPCYLSTLYDYETMTQWLLLLLNSLTLTLTYVDMCSLERIGAVGLRTNRPSLKEPWEGPEDQGDQETTTNLQRFVVSQIEIQISKVYGPQSLNHPPYIYTHNTHTHTQSSCIRRVVETCPDTSSTSSTCFLPVSR